MKKFTFLTILNFAALVAFAQVDTSAYRLQALTIQKKYAPDKRSVYFNLQIKGDSVKLESTSEEALRKFDLMKPAVTGVSFSSVLLPSAAMNGLEYAVANISVGNNRANPQHSAELMTQTLLGMPLRALKKQGGYYLVQTPDGYLSWTDGGAIKLMNKEQFENWRRAEKMIFIADYGHCFSNSNVKSLRVSDLVNGNILQLLGEERNFYKLAFPDGRIGLCTQKPDDAV